MVDGDDRRKTGITFSTENHHGTHGNIKVQIIDYCDANNQERHGEFWVFNLNTLEPKNSERAQK